MQHTGFKLFCSLQSAWRNPWSIVFASTSGLMVTAGTLNVFAFAVFLKPVSEDLGIGRSALSFGVVITNLICGIATPFVGGFVDTWGSRNVLIVGIPLFAGTVATFSWLQASPGLLYLPFVLAGVFGAAQSTVPYAKVVSSWFDRQRGLALGIATAGVGLGVAVVPVCAETMISMLGWRMAYVGLAGMVFALAFIPVFLFVRDPGPLEGAAQGLPAQAGLRGMTAGAAALTWQFWALSGGYCLNVIALHGAVVQIVAMLNDEGLSLQAATMTLSLAGLAMIIGRILSGWCLDHFAGPRVALCFQIVPSIGIVLLLSGTSSLVALGTLLCGLGMGAHTGLLAFFTSRYFGLSSYGKIYGIMFGVFLIGGGIGPWLSSISYDYWNSYRPAMWVFAAVLVLVAPFLARLGPYPFGVREPVAATLKPQPVTQ